MMPTQIGKSFISSLAVNSWTRPNFVLALLRSKYFRGRRIQTDFDIRVEQAEFSELSVNAGTENGAMASIIMQKTGNKVVR